MDRKVGSWNMNYTEDLVYWPLLRWLDHTFLPKVYQFYMLDEGHSCFLVSKRNEVFGFGRNFHGCLGLGHDDRVDQPILIKDFRDRVRDFYIGNDFALTWTYSGKLYGWSWGQLQLDQAMEVDGMNSAELANVKDKKSSVKNCSTRNRSQATPRLLFTGVSQVSVGLKHAAIVKSGKLIILHSKDLANVRQDKFLEVNEDEGRLDPEAAIKDAEGAPRKRARNDSDDVNVDDEFNDEDGDIDDDDDESSDDSYDSTEMAKKKAGGDNVRATNAKLFARAVLNNVSQVTCCYEGTLALVNIDNDTQLYALGDFTSITFQQPTVIQLESEVKLEMLSGGRTEFLVLNASGSVYHCHWDCNGLFKMKLLEGISEPIGRVLSRWEYNYFVLKSRTSQMTYIWEPMPRLSRTILSAMDAYSLYAHSVTLTLTSYSYQARKRPVEWFNDPSHSTMVFLVDTRAIYINRDILAKASPYFATQFEGEWAGCDTVPVNDTRFPVLFTYLRLLHSSDAATHMRTISDDLKPEITNLVKKHGTNLDLVFA